MLKVLGSIVALSALVSLPAAAEPRKMTSAQLDEVVAGTGYTPPPPPYCPPAPPTNCRGGVCGNNGWGNGADPSNPGSGSGGTSPSKLANFNLPPGASKINTNPTGSTGR